MELRDGKTYTGESTVANHRQPGGKGPTDPALRQAQDGTGALLDCGTRSPPMRVYAAVLLRDESGMAIGVLSILRDTPRNALIENEQTMLRAYANRVMRDWRRCGLDRLERAEGPCGGPPWTTRHEA